MTTCAVTDHLRAVLRTIETDLRLELRAHEAADEGGFLSVSRQVFCYVDYLGSLAGPDKGKASDRAISFMETYFGRVNTEYQGKCELMYDMWRHGTVHEFDAKVFASEAESFKLYWGANNTSTDANRKWHLKCLNMLDEPGQYHWWINLFQLVDDLEGAIESFLHDLEEDAELRAAAQVRFEGVSGAVNVDTKTQLKAQAQAVIASAKATIGPDGSVVSEG